MSPIFDHAKQTFRGYLQQPIPDASDEPVERILAEAANSTSADREALRASVSLKDAQVFNAFAQRMAVRAVREMSPDILRLGLLSLAMAGASDYRENIMVLSLLARSAEKLGTDLGSLIESCSDVLPTQARNRFREFESWPEADRSIRAMGFAESGTDGSFNYVRVSPWV